MSCKVPKLIAKQLFRPDNEIAVLHICEFLEKYISISNIEYHAHETILYSDSCKIIINKLKKMFIVINDVTVNFASIEQVINHICDKTNDQTASMIISAK